MPKPNIGQGDGGESFVFGSGRRFPKDSAQFEVLGVLDELNSFLGFARTLGGDKKIDTVLQKIQEDLFVAGANIGIEEGYEKHKMIPRFKQSKVTQLLRVIKQYEKDVPELKNFVLPGGHPQAAALYYCRALARTAERRVVTLRRERSNLNPHTQAYLNRLSDVFFALARYINYINNTPETPWQGKK